MVFHTQSENIKLNPKINVACAPDVQMWCSDVSPGEGKVHYQYYTRIHVLYINYYCICVYNVFVCVSAVCVLCVHACMRMLFCVYLCVWYVCVYVTGFVQRMYACIQYFQN